MVLLWTDGGVGQSHNCPTPKVSNVLHAIITSNTCDLCIEHPFRILRKNTTTSPYCGRERSAINIGCAEAVIGQRCVEIRLRVHLLRNKPTKKFQMSEPPFFRATDKARIVCPNDLKYVVVIRNLSIGMRLLHETTPRILHPDSFWKRFYSLILTVT
jgi:hypothetical protein